MSNIDKAQTVAPVIERATELTSQSRARDGNVSNIWVVNHLARAGLILSPWWSTTRDIQLRNFWKGSDHLSGALYAMISRMSAIPYVVIPRDRSIRNYVTTADNTKRILEDSVEFGGGWVGMYSKFVEDLLTQDNGAFLEVIAPGRTDQPVLGMPISLANLDSGRCTRTGDPIHPIIYQDVDGRRYLYHTSRVIFASQMESPISEMNGVGFCAVSRCVNIAQTLMDIIVYKQEKLGSRPHRQIIITKGGLDPNDLQTAFQLAENNMDSQGLSRYAKVVVGGSSAIPEAGLEVLELSSMPDGFDEQTSIVLGMATIALALGTDPRDLFPAMQGGATRADALLQHLKQRGKGPGQIIQATEQQINSKFLPPYLQFKFDFQDDSEDRQRAEIRKIRADARVQDMSTGAMPDRIIREKMLEDGDLTYEQFEYGELTDGRLVNGNDALSLFFSKDPNIKKLLNLGVEDPLDISGNNPEDMKDRIRDKYENILEILANSNSPDEIWEARRCQSALVKLELAYLNGTYIEDAVVPMTDGSPTTGGGVESRVRTVDSGAPTESDTGNPDHDAEDTSDDEPV